MIKIILNIQDSGFDNSAIFSGDPLQKTSKCFLFTSRTITLIRCKEEENGNWRITPNWRFN
jgi:hypothetical protein